MGILNRLVNLFAKDEKTEKVTELRGLEEITIEPTADDDDIQTVKRAFEPAKVEISMTTDIDFQEQIAKILDLESTRPCFGRKPHRMAECNGCCMTNACVKKKIAHNFNGD